MARVDYLALSINPLPLFSRRVEIPRLEIGDSRIFLQRNAEGQNNWVYERQQQRETQEEGWAVDLQSIALRHVELRVLDETRRLDMTTRFNSLDTDAEGVYGMDWESSGSFNDTELTGSGKVGKTVFGHAVQKTASSSRKVPGSCRRMRPRAISISPTVTSGQVILTGSPSSRTRRAPRN